MPLPNSYTLKPNAIPAYFDAMLDAQPPDRFSVKFLENMGFTSTNDRLFVGILKELGFLNSDGAPQQRYYDFLDRSQSKQILADAIREAYADIYTVKKNAHTLNIGDVKNKLRTLYAGKKTDLVIGNIAKTFNSLCQYADFSTSVSRKPPTPGKPVKSDEKPKAAEPKVETPSVFAKEQGVLSLDSLQYHINIILPESRDQAVYDAIFKALKEHLG